MTPDAVPDLIPVAEAARGAPEAVPLAGSRIARFAMTRRHPGGAPAPASAAPATYSAPRPAICGLSLDRPRIMGILNVTPDSFSDGGDLPAPEAVVARAKALEADILDIGGESTRPGATEVPVEAEIARVLPAITALREAGITTPISIDTRKAPVAEAALEAGADMINDVTAGRFDPGMLALAARTGAPICLMHSVADPETMQDHAQYGDVVQEVAAHLMDRLTAAREAGIPETGIILDPGIGFGKTLQHNLMLLGALPLYHGFGVPILLGASRKRFIGTLGKTEAPKDRMPGSVAVALHGAARGAQILRVHDGAETRQALRLLEAMDGPYGS